MQQHYTNIAFISYKRKDKKWAKWLQSKLEHYKLPIEILKQDPEMEFAKNPRHVFRDTTDLSGGVLAKAIKEGLDSSKYLIVICSPRAAESEWVCKEVQDFIDSGREEYIIPFIIEGEPNSKDSEKECFPEALRSLSKERELLGINIKEGGRNYAAVRVVATMFGLKFDTLWDRFQREEKKRMRWFIAALCIAVLILLSCLGAGVWSYHQIKQSRDTIMVNQSRFVAEKAEQLIQVGDSYTASVLLLNTMPSDLEHPERQLTFESVRALYNCKNDAILRGHTDKVYSVSFSPDGKRIVSASADSTVRIWDAESGECLKVLDKQMGEVYSASFSPDGKRIVSAPNGNYLRIWDSETGDSLKVIYSRYLWGENSVSFSPDGKKILLSERNEKYLQLWDMETDERPKVLDGHTRDVNSACFSPSGKHIVSASQDSTIRVWDVETGEGKVLDKYNKEACSASFSYNGKFIVSAYMDGLIRIWDVETSKCIKEINSLKYSRDCSVSFSPDGRFIVAAWFGTGIISQKIPVVEIWDVETGEHKELVSHAEKVNSVSFSPDGKRIISASDDKTIRIYDVSGDNVLLSGDYSGYFNALSFSPDGERILASSHIRRDIQVLNLKTGECEVLEGHTGCVNSSSYSHDGKRIVSASNDSTLRIWDAETGEILKGGKKLSHRCYSASFSPDGKCIVSSYYSGRICRIQIWDTETCKCINVLNGHTKLIESVSFSPDSKHVVSASADKTVRVWDAKSGECEVLDGHTDLVYSASYSPDGKHIVSASKDKTVRVWDVETNECKVLEGHTQDVTSASFSPDGKRIVSCSEDGTIRIWDVESERCLYTHKVSSGAVYSATFSPDGRHIAYSDRKALITMKSLPFEELFRETQERFKNRKLTPEEKRMYYLE